MKFAVFNRFWGFFPGIPSRSNNESSSPSKWCASLSGQASCSLRWNGRGSRRPSSLGPCPTYHASTSEQCPALPNCSASARFVPTKYPWKRSPCPSFGCTPTPRGCTPTALSNVTPANERNRTGPAATDASGLNLRRLKRYCPIVEHVHSRRMCAY